MLRRKLFDAVKKDLDKRFIELCRHLDKKSLKSLISNKYFYNFNGVIEESLLKVAMENGSWLVAEYILFTLCVDIPEEHILENILVPMVEAEKSRFAVKLLENIGDEDIKKETKCRVETGQNYQPYENKWDSQIVAKLLQTPVKSSDGNGSVENTLIHIAAKYNSLPLFNLFLTDNVVIDIENGKKKTALHVAVRYGNVESMDILLRQDADVDVEDNNGNTPLHIAAESGVTNGIKFLLIAIEARITHKIDRSVSDVTDQRDKDRATNDVAERDKQQATNDVEVNDNLLVENTKRDGPVPQHVPDDNNSTLIKVKKGMVEYLRKKNKKGDTPLSISAKRGDETAVKLFLVHGYDFALIDDRITNLNNSQKKYEDNQQTSGFQDRATLKIKLESLETDRKSWVDDLRELLFDLVNASVQANTVYLDRLIEVYKNIIKHCQSDLLEPVMFDTPWNILQYFFFHFDIVCLDFLVDSRLRDLLGVDADDSVIKLACRKGAVRFAKEVFNSDNVYKFDNNGRYTVYDVTNVIPETTSKANRESEKTCLHCIMNELHVIDEDLAGQMLNVEPIKQLTEMYWIIGERFIYIIITIHVIYMSLFVHYYVPTVEALKLHFSINSSMISTSNYTEVTNSSTEVRTSPSGAWIAWPVILVICEIVIYVGAWIASFTKQSNDDQQNGSNGASQHQEPDKESHGLNACFQILEKFVRAVTGSNLFLALIVTWYCAYSFIGTFANISYQKYLEILAITLIVGWLLTLDLFRRINSCQILMKRFGRIVFKDIFSIFIILYLMILFGFGFALHVLRMTELNSDDNYNSAVHSIYMTFNAMLIQGDMFDITTDGVYSAFGGNIHLLRFIYSCYVCFSTIILLNILIAMMNNTYAEERSWMINKRKTLNVDLNLMFDVTCFCKGRMPSFIWGSTKPSNIMKCADNDRFFMWVKKRSTQDRNDTKRTMSDQIENMQDDLNALKLKLSDLQNKMDEVLVVCSRLPEAIPESGACRMRDVVLKISQKMKTDKAPVGDDNSSRRKSAAMTHNRKSKSSS